MTAADLIALAELCEAYDPKLAPDNRADEMPLDLAIAKAVGVAGADWQVARGSVTGYFSGDGRGGFGNPTVLPYTRSLDAALTLVPDGCLFTVRTVWDKMKPAGLGFVSRYEKDEFGGHERLYWMDEHQAVAANPVLALCAAALRARASALPAVAPTGTPSTGPTSLHSLGTGAAEATGDRP